MKTIALVMFLFAVPAACVAAHAPASPKITSIAMEQFECFWGTCPHYVISLNDDGTATYVGLAIAKRLGGVTKHLPAAAFERIVQKVNGLNYFSLLNSYTSKADGCKTVGSDQSSVTFFVTRGGKTKTVYLYYGCELPGVSDKLASLANVIDEATEIEPLLGRSK